MAKKPTKSVDVEGRPRLEFMSRKYFPVGMRIVARPDPDQQKTDGGVVIPDNAKDPPLVGTVVAVDAGLDDLVKVGDRVIWGNMTEIKVPKVPYDGDRVILRWPEEVLAIFEDVMVPESDDAYAARLAREDEAAENAAAWAAAKAEHDAKVALEPAKSTITPLWGDEDAEALSEEATPPPAEEVNPESTTTEPADA